MVKISQRQNKDSYENDDEMTCCIHNFVTGASQVFTGQRDMLAANILNVMLSYRRTYLKQILSSYDIFLKMVKYMARPVVESKSNRFGEL